MVVISQDTVVREALTVDEFAYALGLGRTSIYAMIARGEVRTRTFGARRVIPRSEVARLLHGDENTPDEAP